ncbi:hypothetical protein Tco_0475838 [Tanacetum coccineum]
MEEYIRLEEEKARRRGKVFNWETATYATLSYEPTASSLNNDEIDFRISFDESDDEDPRERNINEYWWRIYKSGDLEVLES